MSFLAGISSQCALLLVISMSSACAQDLVRSAPIEIIHGRPYVQVMVDGKGPFRFVIDTGTGGQAFISGELADQLGLEPAGSMRLSDPTRQGTRDVPVVLIRSLRVAGVEFTQVKAIRHALNFDDTSCQGLLGFTLFRDYLLTLDYPASRMRLARGALAPDEANSVLQFRMPQGIPIVRMRIGDQSIDAQLDSGGTGLSLPEHLAAKLKFAIDPMKFATGESLSTRFNVNGGKLAADVHLGRYTFTRPFVEINAAFPLVNFGACPMQNFALTFDQKNLLVRLDAAKTVLRLAATPTPIRMDTAPELKPRPPGLVPLG